MRHRLPITWLMAAVCLIAGPARGQDASIPREVKVLPIFFVPKDESAPKEDQARRLMRHVEWARARYRELLREQATFAVAERKPLVYRAARPLAFYREQPEGSAPRFVSELLAELKYNRYNCPYILLVVMMNPKEDFPTGGGRPLNGGFDTGGGIIILSSFALDRCPNFQSTLQHELGHAFGLPHVDVYGYDMLSNESMMSYNFGHHTDGFTPSTTPGGFIPEDRRGLAFNQRVFPGLRFDPVKDVPQGYALAERIVTLGPMRIPGQPDGAEVTTDSGEEGGSRVANIVQGRIVPGDEAGKSAFDAALMWRSAKAPSGWGSAQVVFPFEVELTRIAVHSQYSDEHDAPRAVRIAVRRAKGRFQAVTEAKLESADEMVAFSKTKGSVWRIDFRTGESGQVTLRGLRFFSGDDELFPPLVPCPR